MNAAEFRAKRAAYMRQYGRKNKLRVNKQKRETWHRIKDKVNAVRLTGYPFDLSRSREQSRVYVPSIDRIDPSRGYTKDNCRIILFGINTLKSNGHDGDIVDIARLILSSPKLTLADASRFCYT